MTVNPAQLSFYYSPAVTWNDQLKTMCPSSKPMVLQAHVSESSQVQCAENIVALSFKADTAETRSIPAGSNIMIEGLNAHMSVSDNPPRNASNSILIAMVLRTQIFPE